MQNASIDCLSYSHPGLLLTISDLLFYMAEVLFHRIFILHIFKNTSVQLNIWQYVYEIIEWNDDIAKM